MTDKYKITDFSGKEISRLNARLATNQKVSESQLEALQASHTLRSVVFTLANSNKENKDALKMLAKVFDTLESEQQKLWNFPVDPNYHRFFDLPGCKCPKMDNNDRLGTPYAIHSGNCPIHGGFAD